MKTDDDFENVFKVSSIREHVSKKGLWAGALTLMTISDFYGLTKDNKIIELVKKQVPAIIQCINEILSNAVDQAKAREEYKSKKVTEIKATFDIKTGKISIYNNGCGIPILTNSDGIYLIQLAFSEFLAGTNIDKAIDSIKGGTNGLGAKIANVHSDYFTVETVHDKQKYIQEFSNRMAIINKPVVTKTKETDYTKITFIPAYKEFNYPEDSFIDIDNWFRFRMHQTSAYLGQNIKVEYNEDICLTTDIISLANLIITDPEQCKTFETISKNGKHKLNIVVIYEKQRSKIRIPYLTIVNGVVSTKGSHINYIKKIIKNALNERLTKVKNIERTVDLKSLRIIMCGTIPNIEWSGQTKTEVQVSDDILSKYNMSATFIKSICDEMLGLIITKPVKQVKLEHDKYKIAKNATNSKLKKQCILLAAEGDSAITLLRTGLTQKCNKQSDDTMFSPSFTWVGIISLQGVVLNAVKELNEYETSEGTVIIKSDKLKNNKRLNLLADAFGLKYNCKYETQAELNTLNYGKLILCTDQDLDGTGKICPLVLVWLYTFWPKLFDHGIIGKLSTPIIRIYNNNTIIQEFQYEQEYKEFISKNQIKGIIKYYKGLATHSSAEATNMFKSDNFTRNIYIYKHDDITSDRFNVYFGKNPNLRKKELGKPVKYLTVDEYHQLKTNQIIPIGRVQLDIDAKLYKLEAICRQLPHAIDGLNPARRKILMTSIIKFSKESAASKVYVLAGEVTSTMFYHHGDSSLNNTIITMAQSFKGARLYPYLIGVGQFGDRHGSAAGQPRYISVKLNPIVKLIFPPEDRWLLNFVFDEGKRAEPEYFVPVIPMAILESYQIVTEGWMHKSFYRTLESVLQVVEAYIKGDSLLIKTSEKLYKTKDVSCIPDVLLDKYPLKTIDDARFYNDTEYSFGTYIYDREKNIIHIKDLPLGVITETYVKKLEKSIYIEKIEDNSSTDDIDIYVYLKPNVIDTIERLFGTEEIDPIEHCFNLKNSLKPNLNYYSCENTVLSFDNIYLADILYWAPIRRDLYKKRLIREEILLRWAMFREKEIIKYIQLSNEINISKIEDEKSAISILKDHGFKGLCSSVIDNPEYLSNEELENKITFSENFNYILNLMERELTKAAVQIREKRIKQLEDKYNIVCNYLEENPPGATLWLKEINNICNYLKENHINELNI